jgi:hypothetical protein
MNKLWLLFIQNPEDIYLSQYIIYNFWYLINKAAFSFEDCEPSSLEKWRVLFRMIGFISTSVTLSLSQLQFVQFYRYFYPL